MEDLKNLHLVFNGKVLDYIVNCIAQRPYAECAQVLADINAQVSAQQKEEGPTAQSAGPLNGSGAVVVPALEH